MRVVVSQPMYFPWVGILEQIKLAESFVHYDDVQLTKGFFNRVQIKTDRGIRWISIPLRDRHRDTKIDEATIDYSSDWRGQHRNALIDAYRKATYLDEMIDIFDNVTKENYEYLSEIAIHSTMALAEYFGLSNGRKFPLSSELNIGGRSSQRLLDIVLALKGNEYITGHGALNYLDIEIFKNSNVQVSVMNYQKRPYPQLHGAFTPFVSSLDLVANCGRQGADMICSSTVQWEGTLPPSLNA